VQGMSSLVTQTDFSTSVSNNLWSKDYVNLTLTLPRSISQVMFPPKVNIEQVSRKTPVGFVMSMDTNALWENTLPLSVSNITEGNVIITEVNSTAIISTFTLSSTLVENKASEQNQPITVVMDLKKPILEESYEKEIMVFNKTLYGGTSFTKRTVTVYKTYACSLLNGESWEKGCKILVTFGKSVATCVCEDLGVLMVSENILQRTSDVIVNITSLAPKPVVGVYLSDQCEFCYVYFVIGGTGVALICFIISIIVCHVVKHLPFKSKHTTTHRTSSTFALNVGDTTISDDGTSTIVDVIDVASENEVASFYDRIMTAQKTIWSTYKLKDNVY